MRKYDFLIVGSGLFGAVFAYKAIKKGKKCLIVEKRDHVGGNVYTEEIEGITVHRYGAHIFRTSDKMVWNFMTQFSEFNNFVNSPVANYKGELYNLPFNMNTFSKMWGVVYPREARKIIEQQQGEINGQPKNLEEQAIHLVGRDVYEKLIKGYTEKQWGRECKELPACILRRLPVRYTYDNNYFNDRYQGIPEEGYTRIIEKMISGADVELGSDYNSMKSEYDKQADVVIYTGAIDAYFDYCFGPLEYRSLRFDTKVLDIPNYQGVAVMNFTDRETPYTRIIEHKHFIFGMQSKTVITYEYPSEWHMGEEPYYPINDEKNQQKYAQYKECAEGLTNVFFGGRLGEYKYYDMQDTIKSALKLAQKILGK